MFKRFLKIFAALVTVGAIFFFLFAPGYFDSSKNTVTQKITRTKNPLYDTFPFVADLHCDMLLWNRNFFERHNFGHVDFPRMLEANMAFQAFTIVSKVPRNMNIERNSGDTDQIGLLNFAQLRSPATWFSIKSRALQQCDQLTKFALESQGKFRVITSSSQLAQFVKDRTNDRTIVAGMLGLEGAHCLESDINNLTAFYNAGVRFIGLAHFFDNEWAGSAHGLVKGGLTIEGKKMVKKLDSMRMIIDLAHSSIQTIDDVLTLTTAPLIVSHTGLKGVCNNQRNLTDDHILKIGARNGLIGIGLWETAVCGTDAEATARSIRYVVDKIGVDKVALGSDFDGAIQTHFDVTGLSLIADALEKSGFNPREIQAIMGGNIRDFLLKNLPM